MLGVWNEILVGLQHVRAIAHRRQVFDLLPKDLTRFDRQPTLRFFFSDEHAKFIDFDEGAGFGLW